MFWPSFPLTLSKHAARDEPLAGWQNLQRNLIAFYRSILHHIPLQGTADVSNAHLAVTLCNPLMVPKSLENTFESC